MLHDKLCQFPPLVLHIRKYFSFFLSMWKNPTFLSFLYILDSRVEHHLIVMVLALFLLHESGFQLERQFAIYYIQVISVQITIIFRYGLFDIF